MDLRRLVRGTVGWDRLEAVGRELARRRGRDAVRVSFLDADNWLSTPLVVDDRWFVKLVTRQNAAVHALLTAARNLGAFSSRSEGFFGRFDSPVEMAEHELVATRRMREVGVNAPAPVEAFECEGLGVLVLEYLPAFRTLDDATLLPEGELPPALFDALRTMHDNDLAHGDLRAENVLLHDGDLYFIDATTLREESLANACAYDLACALGVLAPRIGGRAAVDVATEYYGDERLLAAREFLDFVDFRPDHDFDVTRVKGEIEKQAA